MAPKCLASNVPGALTVTQVIIAKVALRLDDEAEAFARIGFEANIRE